MKKIPLFAKILIGLAVVIAIFLIMAAFQPSQFDVKRSALISAPAAAVFPHVNTLKNWEAWNPWLKLDPNVKSEYSGPPGGVGASYHWAGNSEVGEGRMTIMESRPDEFIRLKLEFVKPMEATSSSEFTFRPLGDQTEVTWRMHGENNFVAKAITVFMSMDKMLGESFDQGLGALRTSVESAVKR